MKSFISLAILLAFLVAPAWAAATGQPEKKCQQCGVVQGVIPTGGAHQLLIKMDDTGLTRTIAVAGDTTLDVGDRVQVLGGTARLIVPDKEAEKKPE